MLQPGDKEFLDALIRYRSRRPLYLILPAVLIPGALLRTY